MRNLVIKRENAFSGSLKKYYVYVKDEATSDIKIRKVPCKKLGAIKNNSETVFQIPEEETVIYVIGGKFSKWYRNELVRIPASNEDVYLSGKCIFNPFLDFPFRFNGITDVETINNRKKCGVNMIFYLLSMFMLGAVLGVLFSVILIGMLEAQPQPQPEPETYTVDEMQITLLDSFYQLDVDGYGATFSSEEVSVFAFKNYIPSEKEYQDMTLQEYGVLSANFIEENYFNKYGGNCSDFKSENGFNYIEYQINNEDGSVYYYKEYLYEVSDGFWSVRFVCLGEEAYVANYNSFDEWASSVTFTEAV